LREDLVPQVEKAIEILKNGGIVAFPTDTVYALGAMANETSAIKKIFEVKERPFAIALPLLLASESELDCAVANVPPAARKLTYAFWPGALTLILKKAAWLPGIINDNRPDIAVRVPNHEVPAALIKGVGMPITGTSANLHGHPNPTTAEGVREQLVNKVDLIIDGGRTPVGLESTILDLTVNPPKLLREGAISRAEIAKIIALV
jgi:L-threonylcarbamoyladenylate synthase